MSSKSRRFAVAAVASVTMAMGMAGSSTSAAVAQEPEPCYVHGASEPYLTCMVENAIWRVEQILPIW
jgi:ABC-type sugar transport system substrate-binding protein